MIEQTPSTSSTPRRGLSIGVVLCLVALIPVVGLSIFTLTSVRDARAAGRSAERTEQLAEQTVALAKLNAAVFDEMVWYSVRATVGALDAPSGVLVSLVNADPEVKFVEVTVQSDALAAEAERPDVAAALATARAANHDLSGLLIAYGDVLASIDAPLEQVLAEASSAAAGTQDGEALIHSIDALRLVVDTRALTAQEFYAFFASLFDFRDSPATETSRLIALRAELAKTLDDIRDTPTVTPELLSATEMLVADDRSAAFAAAVDEVIAERLMGTTPELGAELNFVNLINRNAVFSDALQSMIVASDVSVVMLGSAVDQVLLASSSVRAAADEDIAATYRLAVALIGASVLTAAMAARFVIRPLRQLRIAAEHLQSDADPGGLAAIGGPSEVRSAGRAISQAGLHFELVTRQAKALSTGALDAEVLDEVAPGGLGIALQHAVGTLRSALTQQDEFRRRLAHEAAHDGLTNIANRNASVAQLSRSLARTTRSGGQVAVLFIDLDHFKDVNDTHGHLAGDAVLATVAQRLVNSVREGDHVGRLGGDEFVVIAEPVSGIDEAVGLAERIIDELSRSIGFASGDVSIGASIGIALTDGAELTADELLRDADLAVYQAKDTGRGSIAVCDEDLRIALAQTADLTAAIRQAIELDEFIVFYQPIVDTVTERLHAFEALVRWRRPGHEGLVPPDDFIGFAERSKLIIDIDRWVLNAAISQAAAWKSDPRFDGVPIAINVSGKHLADDDFVDHVLGPLGLHGVDPHKIIVEITESALLEDLSGAAVKLQRLRDVGVLVSIDDFGTGYTSLAHLRSLPIDVLKIDRSFTINAGKNEHEASIVKLIIDTGHLLGATVTAEGIETSDDVANLSGMGTDNLQGFYYARPMPPEDVSSAEVARTADHR